MTTKRFVLALSLFAALAGCGSDVKLNDVPVEDRTSGALGSDGRGANGSGTGQSSVAPVDLARASDREDGPPSSVGRLVYFDYDSYVIKSDFQNLIQENARFLRAAPNRQATLEGHTDQRGGSEYNLALGQRRAEAVKRALELLGVSSSQLEAVSFGKEKPADSGSDEQAMAQNRRVEIGYRR
ncbi:MAG: peptidoglycan-associated lipoprotein Pal [Burkholderiales bacterium]